MSVEGGRLTRELGVWSAGAVLVGSTIGSGIFRVPSTVAAQTGSVSGIVAVWVMGAVISLFGALALAELATLHPRSGGVYVFLREAYGPQVAFLFGWTQLVVIRPSALGAIAVIFAEYLRDLVGPDMGVRAVAATVIVGVGLVNMRSVRWGMWLENGTAGAKVVALGVVAVAGLWLALRAGVPAPRPSPVHAPWTGIGVALVAALWAFDGWADLTFMAGEVKDPGRNLPRALAGGVAVVVVVYLLMNAVYLSVLSVQEMAVSGLVAASTATRLVGAWGGHLVALLVVITTLGALNGAMMTGPRIFFAMAQDGMMWRPIAAVHPRHHTPWAAVGLASVLGVAYVSVRSFEELAGGFILGIWPFYALAVGAVMVLRRRSPDAPRPYRTPGYPWVPLVFLAASVGLLGSALIQEPRLTLFGFAVILAGIPVYRGMTATRAALSGSDR